MRVLVACEFTGTVRRAFRELGHEAWSGRFAARPTPVLHMRWLPSGVWRASDADTEGGRSERG